MNSTFNVRNECPGPGSSSIFSTSSKYPTEKRQFENAIRNLASRSEMSTNGGGDFENSEIMNVISGVLVTATRSIIGKNRNSDVDLFCEEDDTDEDLKEELKLMESIQNLQKEVATVEKSTKDYERRNKEAIEEEDSRQQRYEERCDQMKSKVERMKSKAEETKQKWIDEMDAEMHHKPLLDGFGIKIEKYQQPVCAEGKRVLPDSDPQALCCDVWNCPAINDLPRKKKVEAEKVE